MPLHRLFRIVDLGHEILIFSQASRFCPKGHNVQMKGSANQTIGSRVMLERESIIHPETRWLGDNETEVSQSLNLVDRRILK